MECVKRKGRVDFKTGMLNKNIFVLENGLEVEVLNVRYSKQIPCLVKFLIITELSCELFSANILTVFSNSARERTGCLM